MNILDKVIENRQIAQDGSKSFVWSCINEVENRLVYFDFKIEGTKIVLSCYDLKKPMQ